MPARDPQRRLWNEAVETMSRVAMRALQFERLKRQVAYNHAYSPYYRERLDGAGIHPGAIRDFDDFAYVPLMDKAEHRRVQQESLARHGWAGALLACAPREKIVRISATTPTPFEFTYPPITLSIFCPAQLAKGYLMVIGKVRR